MTNLDSILKSRDITLLTKVHRVKAMVFPYMTTGKMVGKNLVMEGPGGYDDVLIYILKIVGNIGRFSHLN